MAIPCQVKHKPLNLLKINLLEVKIIRTGLVYKIENKLSNKTYVGQTVTSLNERWSGHKCDAKRKNTPLYASMKKHINNIDDVFTISVLEENIPYTNLDDVEINWISRLNSLHPNGYNISEGGRSFRTERDLKIMSERVKGEKNPMYGNYGELNPFYGKKHSEDTKKLLSNLATGRKTPDDVKEKISDSIKLRHKKLGHPFQGGHHTDEAKEKIALAMKGRFISDETKIKMSANNTKKQPVMMIDKESGDKLIEFDSMTLAANWIADNTKYSKAKSGQISSVCIGKRKSAYGYKWEYLKGVETIS